MAELGIQLLPQLRLARRAEREMPGAAAGL